ncbi:MAG: permease [Methanobacteriales archaeon HGW-Methanobacteriales-1]|jgi:predicted PurR-regulated permease PerM|nr:MAG: permease [Methanobacteriales archaeon HGW-Methanobacteriales-1]
MIDDLSIPPFLRQISILAIVIIFIMGLNFTAPIVAPILLSIFLAVIIVPFLLWLNKKGVPYNIAHLITIIGVIVLGLFIIDLFYVTIIQLKGQLPNLSISSSSILAGEANTVIQSIASTLASSGVSNLANIIENGFFVLLATVFLVYETPKMKERLIKALGKGNPKLDRILILIHEFIQYFVIRIRVNLFAAVGITIILFIPFGPNFAILWGLLTFILGFIPYIGIIIATILPALMAWAKYGLEGALAVVVLFAIINTIAESFIFPRQTSKGLQLSMYVVFVSLFLWGWILGPIGVFLAVPLTIVVVKYLENFEETRWLAFIMKSGEDDT